ncbi:MAG: BrnA antitoxin family protein [bacterium]|nr:BrnA antitoxin family protein [bacterium]
MKNKNVKVTPKFKTEDAERTFWATVDATEYFDVEHPIELDLSKLKPSTESISLRLPSYMLGRIKEMANSRDVPYQSLMKMFLSERIDQELRRPQL